MSSKFALLALWVLISACGIVKRGTIPWEERAKKIEDPPKEVVQKPASFAKPSVSLSKGDMEIRGKLDEAFEDWKGVPYLFGGTDFDGVDCSGFLQAVFADYFDVSLPRVTDDQIKVGKSVKKKDIRIGDLVFFKTGQNSMHAGVMINNQEFMHASTSSGVMISALQERYWSDAYLTTRRVL